MIHRRWLPLVLLPMLACLAGCKDDPGIFDDCPPCDKRCRDDEGAFDYEGPAADCGATPPCLATGAGCGFGFAIEEATIDDVHAALAEGRISCEWLVEQHLTRILHHDLRVRGGAPPLNAFVTLNEAALETARKLDAHQQCSGELAGPLHCVPFVVKTNYGSKEVPTTNGSWALRDAQPDFDAWTVERIRAAGGVLLGSTAMDEFAQGIHGISGRSGRTGNAYDTRRNAGGSSGGAAVAVAASFAMAGLGTDNCASLTAPAGYNGLFTMRASHGLVSTEGIFPSNRLDMVAGPMTRTVKDLAILLDVMSEPNPDDPAQCHTDEPMRPASYTEHLRADGLRGKRIGVLRALSDETSDGDRFPYEGGSKAAQAHFTAFLHVLTKLGAEVVDDIELPEFNGQRKGSGSGYETDLYLARTRSGVRSGRELCRTGLYSHHVFASEADCLSRMEQTLDQLERWVAEGSEHYARNRRYIEARLDALGLDALVYPSDARGTALVSGSKANCILPSVTGLPTAGVHTGHVDGLPVGFMFTARMHDEATLFEIAYAIEQGLRPRRAPELSPVTGAPALDVATFNKIHEAIGRAAFEQVLETGDKFDLTGPRFTRIVREVLEDNGLSELVEE